MALFVRGNIACLFVQMLVFLAVVQTILSSNMKYKIRANCKIIDGYSMEECTAGSLMNCVTKCTTRSDCISVAWNLQTYVCMLSEYDTIFEKATKLRSYEEAADWTCASLVRFPVFMALNSTYATKRYEMAFPRASARCAELGTTLAYSSILATAQKSLDLHYCSCGWMADGTNAVVLDYYQPKCIGNKGVVRCGSSTANAWCLMP